MIRVESGSRGRFSRSELAIKLAMAVTAPVVDVAAVVQVQRVATVRHLQDLTRLRRQVTADDLAWSLLLQNLIFTAEAEVRWLDHAESELAQRGVRAASGAADPLIR